MKKPVTIKHFFLLFLFSFFLFGLVNSSMTKVEAEDKSLQVMTTSSGTALTYRNSSEKVYGLSEYDYPVNDLRGCWVSNFAGDMSRYTSEANFKTEYTNILNNMQSWGLNTIVFHIRTHNNALYKSKLNPVATFWENVNFDEFDPLEWAISETHKRGMEFHAWMNPYRISDSYVSGSYPEGNPANDSSNILSSGSSRILDPGLPNVRQFIVDTCMEVIENYDVDAINFDDYFYISGCDDSATQAKYNTDNLSTDNFRRKQVDLFIESLSKTMRSYNEKTSRCVQLGIAPTGIYRNGSYVATPSYNSNGDLVSPLGSNTAGQEHYKSYLCCDTVNWINHEWIDYIMPQTYWGMEMNVAHFYELSKYWSWVVKNKKVNLYLGSGVYMALSNSGSWNNNPDEMKNQILNCSMYDEVNGMCYYKYSSLLSTSNTVLNNGKETLQTYWAKQIPSAVSKYYKDKVASITPTGVNYNTSTSVLSWQELDNVRGYLVYRTKKGTELDKENIDSIVKYQTNTSINVSQSEMETYDYYISSVNYANVSSTPASVNTTVTGEMIKNQIENMVEPVTLKDQEKLSGIRSSYDKLSDTEKAVVTNLDKLVRMEQTMSKLVIMNQQIDDFVATLDLHITTNRSLPTKENLTWSYKDINDSLDYNFISGTKSKNYLNTHLITLLLTNTQDGLTLSKEVNVNIGMLGTDQIGLFYRNDASSMSEVDSGAYGPSSTSFIGWSNVCIIVGNAVLFVAKGNYFDVKSASDISTCHWMSCAGVYKNSTGANLTLTGPQMFTNESSSTAGYFVLGSDNTIRAAYPNVTYSSLSVTLAPGETLVYSRYLDTAISGNPLTPASNIVVGTSAFVLDTTIQQVITDADYAQGVIVQIENLKDTAKLTLSDEQDVKKAKTSYDALTESQKAYVTNVDKLNEALAKIETLKEEQAALELAKTNAIQELNNYVDLSDYCKDSQTLIKKYIADATTTIQTLETKEDILRAVEATKVKINGFEKSQVWIDEALQDISTYEKTVDLTQYRGEKLQEIANLFTTARTNIQELREYADIQNLVTKLKKDVGNVLTISQEKDLVLNEIETSLTSYKETLCETVLFDGLVETKQNEIMNEIKTKSAAEIVSTKDTILTKAKSDLKSYFDSIMNEINEAISKVTGYEDTKNILTDLKTEYSKKIQDIKTLDEINPIYQEFIEKAENVQSSFDLAEAKSNAKSEIGTWKSQTSTEDYRTTNYNTIISICDNAIKSIDSLTSSKEINDLLAETKSQIEEVLTKEEELAQVKVEITKELTDYCAALILEKGYQTEIETKRDEELKGIFTNTLEDLLSSKSTYLYQSKLKIDTLVSTLNIELTNSQSSAKSTINSYEDKNKKMDSLKKEYVEKVDNAKTIDEVNTLVSEFKTKADAMNNEKASGCFGTIALQNYLMILAALGLMMLLKKKH